MLTRRSQERQTQTQSSTMRMQPMRSTKNARSVLRTAFSVGAALVLGAMNSVVVVDTAHAGPDQDRVTITRQHVDAPVPAWDARTKTLSILVNQDPANTRVLWLGRGWGGTTSYPIIKHLFSVPDDPQLSFLGDVGTTWLSAPQDPGPGNSPIWAGIGVDGSLSGASSQFEANNYVLDLVSVNGPGRMELFTRTTWGVRRNWSSHDLAYRTIFNPRHMHAFTTFSKPGRYEVNVAAVARDARGNTVYTSHVTPVVWQVGGNRPDQGAIKDFRSAFTQAPTQRADGAIAQPQFTVGPKTNFQTVGDEFLTDFTFNTGNTADNGHLIVTIDGFYMNEVPVVNGVATFDEMIGDSTSTFQAIYIPGDGTSTRWASQPIEFSRLHKEAVNVTDGTDELVAEHAREASPTLTPADQQITSGSAELAITPLGESSDYSVALRADEHLNATYKLAFYRDKRTDIADCTAEGTLFKGQALFTGSFGYCKDYPVVRVSILPHPYANVAPVTLTVDNPDLSTARVYPLALPLRTDNSYDLVGPKEGQKPPTSPQGPGTPTPEPRPELPPIVEQPPSVQTLLREPIELTQGHLDLRLVPSADGGVTLAIKDDSLTSEKKSVLREPSSVTLAVPHSALMRRNEQMKAPAFDFLGPVGTQNYVLPETQADSLVWPGFSTEGIDYATYPQGIDYEVTLADGPANGVVSFVTTAGVGNEVNVRIRTNDPAARRIRTTESTHLHGAWIFSQPGVYRLSVRATSAGKEIARAKTLTFAVDRDARPLPPATMPTPPNSSVPPKNDGNASPNTTPKGTEPKVPGTEPKKEPQPGQTPAPGKDAHKSGTEKKQDAPSSPKADPRIDLDMVKNMTGKESGDKDSAKSSPEGSSSHDGASPAIRSGGGSPATQTQGTQQGAGVFAASSGQGNAPSANGATRSPSRGRIVNLDVSRSSNDAAQSADSAQSDSAQSDGAQSSEMAQSAQGAQSADASPSAMAASAHEQRSAADAESDGESSSFLGGYSATTLGIILASAIAAGSVSVVAIRKSIGA